MLRVVRRLDGDLGIASRGDPIVLLAGGQSNPPRILAQGADWRLLRKLKKELKG